MVKPKSPRSRSKDRTRRLTTDVVGSTALPIKPSRTLHSRLCVAMARSREDPRRSLRGTPVGHPPEPRGLARPVAGVCVPFCTRVEPLSSVHCRFAMTVHLVNPSHLSFGIGVITPRWMFVLAAATPSTFGSRTSRMKHSSPSKSARFNPGMLSESAFTLATPFAGTRSALS